MPSAGELWAFLAVGYLITICLETPVLLVGLSKIHPLRRRFLAGLWLTACTYPIVVLVLPFLVWEPFGRVWYLVIAETFAPLAECVLFYFAYLALVPHTRACLARDMAAIALANLTSFLSLEIVQWLWG